MLKIRLQRTGRKHEPTFRVVLTDSKNGPKSGKFIEILGNYDARDKNETNLKSERITHWIKEGAQVSDTLHNLLIQKDIIKGEKINVLPKKSPIKKEGEEEVKEAPAKEETPAEEVKEETPTTEETPAEEVKEETPATEETPTEEVKEESSVEEVKEETSEEKKEE